MEHFSWIKSDPADCGVGMHDQTGKRFVISQEDIPLMLSLESFVVSPDGYVRARRGSKRHLLHRLILGATAPTPHIDHINRNPSDNRRSNLRLASITENNRNQGLRRNNTSGFKGVSYDKRKRKYCAGIGLNATRVALGQFATAEEAARAYDRAARKHYGSFAVLNFPEEA